jgi:hypothetical protein
MNNPTASTVSAISATAAAACCMWSADLQHVRVFDRGSTGALCLGSCDRDRGFKGAFCSGYIAPECQQFALFGDFDRIELDTTDGQSHGRTFECEFLTIAEVC